ncbi:hypothetical protein AB0M12_35600 [Nocardia vinacea]
MIRRAHKSSALRAPPSMWPDDHLAHLAGIVATVVVLVAWLAPK